LINWGLTLETTLNSNTILPALLHEGKEFCERGDNQKGLRCFERALAIGPENETALLWCAMLTQDPFIARSLLNTLLEISPENEAARIYYKLIQNECVELVKNPYENDFKDYWEKCQGEKGVPPLGQYLLQAGLLSEGQLNTALTFQKYLYTQGGSKKLGEILMSFGYINSKQLDHALQMQHREFTAQRLSEIDAVRITAEI
jgi:tetratricopeptide (TPR) repeat protein